MLEGELSKGRLFNQFRRGGWMTAAFISATVNHFETALGQRASNAHIRIAEAVPSMVGSLVE
jgi:hypothetical protein